MHDTVRTGVIVAVGLCACLLLLRLSSFVYTLSKDEQKISANIVGTLDTLNQDCGSPANYHPCGTLADVAKTLNTVRGAFGQIEVAANHENKNLAALDAQEVQLFADIHATLAAGRGTVADLGQTAQQATSTLHTLDTTVSYFQPIAGHVDLAAVNAGNAVERFNTLLADPVWLDTARNVDGITKTTGQMLDTANQVETKAMKSYLHPPTSFPARFWLELKPFIVPSIQIGGAVAAASIR